MLDDGQLGSVVFEKYVLEKSSKACPRAGIDFYQYFSRLLPVFF
jgi:hypothetical protein